MSEVSDRSVVSSEAMENVGAIDLDVLLSRADELTMHSSARSGDVVGVAAEVQRLGFAIERVLR